MKFEIHEAAYYLCPPLTEKYITDEIDMESILSHEAVTAQQDYICGEIGAPTTIIQFRRDEKGDWERIDSRVSAITLRTSCDILRRCINNEGKLCRECDAQHAELFYMMDKDQILSGEVERRIEKMQKQWDKDYQNSYHKPYVEIKDGRAFLSYSCPMFGYRELVFPIFFEKNTVAVFIIGQMKVLGDEDVIIESKKNFFRLHPNIFDTYINDCQQLDDFTNNPEKYKYNEIIKYITNKSNRGTKPKYPELYDMEPGLQIPEIEDSLSLTKYAEIVSKTCKWLDDLEKQLIVEMQRKRERHARRVLAEAMASFHIDSANANRLLSGQEALWRHVQAFAQKVSKQCQLEYMVIYSTQSVYEKTVRDLKVVASSKTDDDTLALSTFSLVKPSVESIMQRPSDSKSSPELFNALNRWLSRGRAWKSVVFQPMSEIPAASVAILVKYSSDSHKNSIEDTVISSLQNLSALISARLAMWFENAAQLQLEKTLRLYKHEMVNLSASVSRAINDYLGNSKLKEIDKQKLDDVYRDAAGTLNMFEFLSENIGILIDNPIPPKKEIVWLYKDLLYKWENIKRVDARDKGCDFVFQKAHISIYTDPRYAELVVYNLLTNAVKYSYDNTKIHIHCTDLYSNNSYTLSVTNFSFLIPETERSQIFGMGYRAQEARDYYPEGSGIGLWIVRETIKLLGGTVRLRKPKLISGYNVPLLYACMNSSNPYEYFSADEEFQKAKSEYNRLCSEYIINDFGKNQNIASWIVSKYNWFPPAKSKIKAELTKETYIIRFEVKFDV